MKRYLLLALVALFTLTLCAQEQYDPRTNNNIIFKRVGDKWKLRDKIIVSNRTPYIILQVVVCDVINHTLRPIGNCGNINPGERCSIADFDDNQLGYLRGRTIAIKAKGAKDLTSDEVTYEFDAKLYEDRHDLYIELYSAAGNSVMDF